MIDHDKLFKILLATFFLEFMQLFYPEIAAEIEPNSVTEQEQELFSDIISGETFTADKASDSD